MTKINMTINRTENTIPRIAEVLRPVGSGVGAGVGDWIEGAKADGAILIVKST